jgi:hypothetical protein
VARDNPHCPGESKYMTTTEINIPDALRDMRTNWYFCSMDSAKVLLAAADEIERLRAALAHAESTILHLSNNDHGQGFD